MRIRDVLVLLATSNAELHNEKSRAVCGAYEDWLNGVWEQKICARFPWLKKLGQCNELLPIWLRRGALMAIGRESKASCWDKLTSSKRTKRREFESRLGNLKNPYFDEDEKVLFVHTLGFQEKWTKHVSHKGFFARRGNFESGARSMIVGHENAERGEMPANISFPAAELFEPRIEGASSAGASRESQHTDDLNILKALHALELSEVQHHHRHHAGGHSRLEGGVQLRQPGQNNFELSTHGSRGEGDYATVWLEPNFMRVCSAVVANKGVRDRVFLTGPLIPTKKVTGLGALVEKLTLMTFALHYDVEAQDLARKWLQPTRSIDLGFSARDAATFTLAKSEAEKCLAGTRGKVITPLSEDLVDEILQASSDPHFLEQHAEWKSCGWSLVQMWLFDIIQGQLSDHVKTRTLLDLEVSGVTLTPARLDPLFEHVANSVGSRGRSTFLSNSKVRTAADYWAFHERNRNLEEDLA